MSTVDDARGCPPDRPTPAGGGLPVPEVWLRQGPSPHNGRGATSPAAGYATAGGDGILIGLTRNTTGWDRGARIALGLLVATCGLAGLVPPPWDLGLLMLAFYLLVTGLTGWDPVYVLLGRGTRNRRGG
mgnify:CR=1 FL=1